MADGAQHEGPGDDVTGSENHVEEHVPPTPLKSSGSAVSISSQSLTAADRARKRDSTASSKDRGPASAGHASEQPGSLPQPSACFSPSQLQLRPQSLPQSVDSHPLLSPFLVRSRSVSFSSPPPAQMERRRSRHASEHGAGSSADETVPIISRERDDRKNYQSISPSITARTSGVAGSNNGAVVESIGQARAREREQRREAQQAAVEAEAREHKWWKKVVEKYGSMELENKGAVARDHLALERTFLAWLRTSLSFASIGIAITQLFRLNTTIASSDPALINSPQARLRHAGKPLGATFIAISILILFIGFHRFFESQHYVIRGKFPASRGSILIVATVAGGLIVVSLVIVLAIAPGAFEK